MERSNVGGDFLSGLSGRLFDMEVPLQRQMGHPTMSKTNQQTHQLHPINMISGLENEHRVGFDEGKGLSLKDMSVDFGKGKGISLGNSFSNNTTSEDEEMSLTEDGNCDNSNGTNGKRRSPWQRMKWTDNVVRLLIAVVASVGDDSSHEGMDGPKRKSGALQKKGKWKMVSNIMISKGCCVSPQQCEDKFNDLNKRYKKLNDILGRGTSCQVVENPSLMDSMTHLTSKAKDEVKKILGSKHLFYREMCAYHNGQRIPGCHDIDLQAHLLPMPTRRNENDDSEDKDAEGNDDSEDDDSYDNGERNVEANTGMMEKYYERSNLNQNISDFGMRMELNTVCQDPTNSPAEQRGWILRQIWQLEEQRVRLQSEALDLEKQRFKWLRFRSKKDRELERLKLENERMKLENERMVLMLKQKGMELGIQKSDT